MFPRIVTIAPGEGARRRQVPPSSSRAPATPRQPPPPSSRAANYSVCSVLPTDGRPMRKRDYGRWTCISFRPFLSFSPFSLALLFSTRVWFPRLLFSVLLFFPFPHPSLPFFSLTSRNFQERLRISGRSATRFLRSFPTGNVYGNRGFIHRLEKS